MVLSPALSTFHRTRGPDIREAGPRARLPGRNVVAQVVPFGNPLEAHRIPGSPAEPGATNEATRHEACLSTKQLARPASCLRFLTPRARTTPRTARARPPRV